MGIKDNIWIWSGLFAFILIIIFSIVIYKYDQQVKSQRIILCEAFDKEIEYFKKNSTFSSKDIESLEVLYIQKCKKESILNRI